MGHANCPGQIFWQRQADKQTGSQCKLLVLLVLLCQPDYLFTPLYLVEPVVYILFIYFFNYLFKLSAHGKFGFSSGNNSHCRTEEVLWKLTSILSLTTA